MDRHTDLITNKEYSYSTGTYMFNQKDVGSNAFKRSPCRSEAWLRVLDHAFRKSVQQRWMRFCGYRADSNQTGLHNTRLRGPQVAWVGKFCSSCHLARKSYVRRQDSACCTVASSCADSDQRCDPRDEQPGLGVAGTVRKVGGPRCSCLLYALRIHYRTLSTHVNARTRIRTLAGRTHCMLVAVGAMRC